MDYGSLQEEYLLEVYRAWIMDLYKKNICWIRDLQEEYLLDEDSAHSMVHVKNCTTSKIRSILLYFKDKVYLVVLQL